MGKISKTLTPTEEKIIDILLNYKAQYTKDSLNDYKNEKLNENSIARDTNNANPDEYDDLKEAGVREIKKLKIGKPRKILTKINFEEGWVNDKIFRQQEIYPDKQKDDYLNKFLTREKGILEQKDVFFINNRGSKVHHSFHRIKRDWDTLETLKKLLKYYISEGKGLFFVESDYFKASPVLQSIQYMVYANILVEQGLGADKELIKTAYRLAFSEGATIVLPPEFIMTYLDKKMTIILKEGEVFKISIIEKIRSFLIVEYFKSNNQSEKELYKKQIMSLNSNIKDFVNLVKKLKTQGGKKVID